MIDIDFDAIIGFEWDHGNERKSYRKHGVSQEEAEQVLFNEPLLLKDDTHSSKHEIRYNALGATHDGRELHVTFTLRGHGTLIRIISARDMNQKERKLLC